MNILVLFGEIAYISNNSTLKGIVECAKDDESNVFLFTCEGFLFHDLAGYSKGEYEVFKLPNIKSYDGVIVDFNTIQNEEIRKYLIKEIDKAGIPCVSFAYDIDNACKIEYNANDAFESMVDHLIDDHGLTNIHFISGPAGNIHSQIRLDLYKKSMQKHGLSVEQYMIKYGDFNLGSGKNIAREYINGMTEMPEAFVAANDFMAIGLIEEFKSVGITCPDQIKVVGVDCSELGQNMTPKLTSVDMGVYNAGVEAYNAIKSMVEDGINPGNIVVDGVIEIGESCGCDGSNSDIANDSYIKTSIQLNESLDLIKALSININEISTNLEFEDKINPIISKLGIEYFYFIQNGSMEEYYQRLELVADGVADNRYLPEYDTAWCPIAYENGYWSTYPVFPKTQILPTECLYKKGVYYIIMPVHRGETAIGYIVMGNFNENLSGRVLQHIVLGFDRALGNIVQSDINKTMMARVNSKWHFDELTGLYNRSGFYDKVPSIILSAKTLMLGMLVVFFDLDDLKKINDKLGHKEGDAYIVRMANAIKSAMNDEEIGVRFGGDEFVVVSLVDSEIEAEIRAFEIGKIVNESVSSSMGFAFDYVDDVKKLSKLVEQADKKMYEDKLKRKVKR